MHCDLSKADFHGRILRNVNFISCNLNGADFGRADLYEVGFYDGSMFGAKFVGSALVRTVIDTQADYSNFRDASFKEDTVLTGDFNHCDFRDSYWEDSKLEHASLCYADVTNAMFACSFVKMLGCNFSQAKGVPSRCAPECFTFNEKGEMIVYKAFDAYYKRPDSWKIEEGSIIEENVDADPMTLCSYGINACATIEDLLNEVGHHKDVWECVVKPQWLPGVVFPSDGHKFCRCEKLQLVRKVEVTSL